MVSNYSDLRGKTVLITGCNRGIGREVLTNFASQGANIVACVRTISGEFSTYLNTLREAHNISVEIIPIDLTSPESITAAMRDIFQRKIQIDILVNNAGIAFGSLFSMTSMSKMREVFEINFFAQVQITQYVVKWMRKRGCGVIINMASIAGIDGIEGFSAYGSSKAALIYFTKMLSKELSASGIRVNAVAPGLINTELVRELDNKAVEKMTEQSSLGRLGTPAEIAESVVFLSSESSSYINGQIIRIDGGM